MIQANRYSVTEQEQEILTAIQKAGEASVKEIHSQLMHAEFLDVMRSIHKLHRKGYVSQKHIGYEAFYKIMPRLNAELQKKAFINSDTSW